LFLRKADGTFAARQGVRFKRPGLSPFHNGGRGKSRPHLLDWDRDGHTDLVIAYPRERALFVSRGPLAGRTEVAVKSFAPPALSQDSADPLEFRFADGDGDGGFDLLVAALYREVKNGPWCYGIFWSGNTSAEGEPKFAAASRLLAIPAPWQVNAFAVGDRDRDGRPDLVVSVHKDWTWKKQGGWSGVSQLWLYRRRP
jgi:hypothetical protein